MDIVQDLRQTRVEHPEAVDHESAIESLTEAGLLTDRQAEALVWSHFSNDDVGEIADRMGGVSESRVYNARQGAEHWLHKAQRTLRVVRGLRDDVRPQPGDHEPDSVVAGGDVATLDSNAPPFVTTAVLDQVQEDDIHTVDIGDTTVWMAIPDDHGGYVHYDDGIIIHRRVINDIDRCINVFRDTVDATIEDYESRELEFDIKYDPGLNVGGIDFGTDRIEYNQ